MNAIQKAPWVICAICRGEGTHSGHLGVVDRDDFDDEEWAMYLEGGYDSTCDNCGGSGKVREGDEDACFVRTGSAGQPVRYRDAADASEHLLRMAEGLV